MDKLKFLLLDIDYITRKSKPVIRLFGKLPDGRSIIAFDKKFEPYMYVLPRDINRCKEELRELNIFKIENIGKNVNGEIKEFLKIILKHPRDIIKLKDKIWKLSSVEDVMEHDIPFYRRYLIDKALFPMKYVEVQGKILKHHRSSSNETCLFEIQNEPKNLEFCSQKPMVLNFNIETCNPRGIPVVKDDPIILISFYSNHGFSKIFSTKESSWDFVETVSNEMELLNKFVETIKSLNPDVLVGYNSDKYDFPYIQSRADLFGIKINLGADGSKLNFYTGRMKFASIKGCVHIDLYKIVRRYLQLNHHTLEKVYLELYKKDKVDIPAEDVYKCWVEEGEKLENLFRYALEDVKCISKIGDKMLTLIIELTHIVGQPMFEIARRGTGTQIKWYLIRKAHENGYLVPNEFGKFERNVVGGYVQEPEQGLHENIFYFDFRSLYPSIIISKNISPETLIEDDDNIECYIDPEFSYRFRKEPLGFIPSVVKELLESRMEIKVNMKKCNDPKEYQMLDYRQDSMKRLSNTVYGLFNHPQFRWYCVKCSEAITAWGKDYLQQTIEKAEKIGFKVVYADTDGFYAVLDL